MGVANEVISTTCMLATNSLDLALLLIHLKSSTSKDHNKTVP